MTLMMVMTRMMKCLMFSWSSSCGNQRGAGGLSEDEGGSSSRADAKGNTWKKNVSEKGNTWKKYISEKRKYLKKLFGKTTFPEKVVFRKKFVMLCDYCIKSNQILDQCRFQ